MNNPLDGAFEQIHKEVDAVVYRELKQIRWEENVVKKILKFYNLLPWEGKLRELCYDRTGEKRLQFCWLFEEFQTFPVWLGMEKVPFLWDIRFSELVSKNLKLKIFEKWEEALDSLPDRGAGGVGFVFEMLQTGNRTKTWLVHDYWRPALRRAYRYLIEDPLANTPRIFVLDELTVFLESLRWQPPMPMAI